MLSTDADKNNDLKSTERKLDRKLILLVKQTYGSKQFWELPRGLRQEGENMRQVCVQVYTCTCAGVYRYVCRCVQVRVQVCTGTCAGVYRYVCRCVQVCTVYKGATCMCSVLSEVCVRYVVTRSPRRSLATHPVAFSSTITPKKHSSLKDILVQRYVITECTVNSMMVTSDSIIRCKRGVIHVRLAYNQVLWKWNLMVLRCLQVFFFKAQLLTGNVKLVSPDVLDFSWVTRDEYATLVSTEYFDQTKKFIVDL
jgi:hypothetical protein